jgi:hypothetical protein
MYKWGKVTGRQASRLVIAGCVAVALAGCSKCDIPTWHRDAAPAPQSCHDDSGVK